MSEPEMWHPATGQLVETRMGAGVIEDITAVRHDNLYHLRFHVRLIEVEPDNPKDGVFGAAEIRPLTLQREAGVYRR